MATEEMTPTTAIIPKKAMVDLRSAIIPKAADQIKGPKDVVFPISGLSNGLAKPQIRRAKVRRNTLHLRTTIQVMVSLETISAFNPESAPGKCGRNEKPRYTRAVCDNPRDELQCFVYIG